MHPFSRFQQLPIHLIRKLKTDLVTDRYSEPLEVERLFHYPIRPTQDPQIHSRVPTIAIHHAILEDNGSIGDELAIFELL